MFTGEDDHRVVKHENIVQAALFRAFAFIMNDPRFGEIVVLITCLGDAVRKVDIFAIHKELLIEQAGFIKC